MAGERLGGISMLFFYTIAIFVSAALLFVVQPMFARMILPHMGGAPSVWNTAMMFYQAMLLAGYAWAHFSIQRLGVRRQAIVQLILLAGAFVFLPLAIPQGWEAPGANPTWPLVGLMFVSLGAPFFVISSTSPVVQRWFASTGHPASSDPYFLYAASNVGSLLALAAYPFLVEPFVGLSAQSRLWTMGYAGLGAAMVGCVVFLFKASGSNGAPAAAREKGAEAPVESLGWPRRGRWVLLAFAPSSLMLSVTTYLSREVASAPLLWTVPLALYLLSFAMVFSRRKPIPLALALRVFPGAVVVLTLALVNRASNPFLVVVLIHLAAFFVAAMACHGELAAERPEPRQLTEFYVWMSVGGALGGVFNSLCAPLMFDSLAEYPLVLVIACLLVVRTLNPSRERKERWLDLGLPLALGGFAAMLSVLGPRLLDIDGGVVHALIFGPPVVLCFFLSESRLRFAGGVAAVFVATSLFPGIAGEPLFTERSFYGAHRVTVSPDGRFYYLLHGSTIHGKQLVEREDWPTPLSYYYPTGPAGEFFYRFHKRIHGPVGAIGMGAGALASYGKKGEQWTFFEIDPVVADLASNSGYFDFIEKSKADVSIVLGDGRVRLGREPDGRFQLLVVDAFSSDVIPLHLLTQEAVALYSRKLQANGMILFHVSNRHFDFKPRLADLALDAGMVCYVREGRRLVPEETLAGMDPSVWMLMAKSAEAVRPIRKVAAWVRIPEQSGRALWTDDRASILEVLY